MLAPQRLLRIFWRGHEFDDDFLACLDARSTTHKTHSALCVHEPYMSVSLYLWDFVCMQRIHRCSLLQPTIVCSTIWRSHCTDCRCLSALAGTCKFFLLVMYAYVQT